MRLSKTIGYFLASILFVGSLAAQPKNNTQLKNLTKQYTEFKKTLSNYRDCIMGKRKCTQAEASNIKRGVVGLVGALMLSIVGVGVYKYWSAKKASKPDDQDGIELKKIKKPNNKSVGKQQVEKTATAMIKNLKSSLLYECDDFENFFIDENNSNVIIAFNRPYGDIDNGCLEKVFSSVIDMIQRNYPNLSYTLRFIQSGTDNEMIDYKVWLHGLSRLGNRPEGLYWFVTDKGLVAKLKQAGILSQEQELDDDGRPQLRIYN